MTGTEISKRYPLFISAFKKEVTKVRTQVEKMRDMEEVYNMVCEVFAQRDLNNSMKINMDADMISISVDLVPADVLKPFMEIVEEITAKMQESGLRNDPTPKPKLRSDLTPQVVWIWSCVKNKKYSLVRLCLNVPHSGCANAVVKQIVEMSESCTYEVVLV